MTEKMLDKILKVKKCRHFGNLCAFTHEDDSYIHIAHYNTIICEINKHTKNYSLCDGGYNTPSTHKHISELHKILSRRKYHLNYVEVCGQSFCKSHFK